MNITVIVVSHKKYDLINPFEIYEESKDQSTLNIKDSLL